MAIASGWTREGESGELFRSPDGFVRGWYELPKWDRDLGAAMSLLMSLDVEERGWSIEYTSFGVEFYSELRFEPLVRGSKEEIATLICRAYLKLKNGSVG